MKTAIVTGATRGIGKEVVKILSSNGYFVFGLYVKSDDSAKRLSEELENVEFVKVDLGQPDAIRDFYRIYADRLGELQVLVNNAGIDLFGLIEKYSDDDWDRMVSVNFTSVYLMAKYALPFLGKSKDSSIITISSRMGEIQLLEPEFVVYSATKAAATIFTLGLAQEVSNISINVFIPAPTKTDLFDEVFTKEDEEELIQQNRLSTPEEAAEQIFAIVQDKSLHGQVIYDPRV